MDNTEWYVEYAVGSVANRNKFCTLNEFTKIARNAMGQEIYRSMFLYHEDINEYVKTNGTGNGYNGIQNIDKIVIDIDYVKDGTLDNGGLKTINNVVNIIDEMTKKTIEPEHYTIWFSGTGFHIHLANVYGFQPSNTIAQQVRITMQRDFGNYIDLIYDPRRLIRAGFSLNKKTNLFKVPIPYTDLENKAYSEIAQSAQMISNDYVPHQIKNEKLTTLDPMDISRKNIKEVRKIFNNARGVTTRHITCIQHIFNAGYVKGHRHKHLLALVSIWRKKLGFDKHACDNLARAYMSKMDNPVKAEESSRIVSDAFKNDYNYGCNHMILQPYCDRKCILFKYKDLDETKDVLDSNGMIDNLVRFANENFEDRSFDLKAIFPFLKQKHVFTTGQLITLIGDTGLGKTAFISYLITQLPHINTLFFSLEVDDITMSRRFLQAALNMSKPDIITALKTRDKNVLTKAEDLINHIKLRTTSPDIQELSTYVANQDCKIIVFDTIDRIPAKYAGKDDFARQEIIANGLKDMAMQEDVIVFAIHHISKSASFNAAEGQRLNVHSGKGNSAIEQKSDQYIAYEGVKQQMIRTVRSVKSRDESDFEIRLKFDWNTFRYDKCN